MHCNTHCNTLQHTATHCNTLQHSATYTEVVTLTNQVIARFKTDSELVMVNVLPDLTRAGKILKSQLTTMLTM